MDVSIRMARLKDSEALAKMRWEDSVESKKDEAFLQAEFLGQYERFLETALSDPRWVIWLAEVNDEVVSHSFVQLIDMVPRPGRFGRKWGYASAVYTTPQLRNRGLGSSLLEKMIQWGREQGLESLLLQSGDRSIPLYERAGFSKPVDAMELELQT